MNASTARATTHTDDDANEHARFLRAVHTGLGQLPKRLPTSYLYDERGSALFDAICDLPEYYLTRTELSIMRTHVDEMAAQLGPKIVLVEYGSGSSIKTRMLLDALTEPSAYVPVDISAQHLERTAAALRTEYPGLHVAPVAADFTRPFAIPTSAVGPRVAYFPGSTIGNFEPPAATALLRQLAEQIGHDGRVLIGFDLRKSKTILEPAYDDAAGVTAAFNLNLLARIRRELDADFDVERFSHRAWFDEEHGRIEMNLISEHDQVVRVGNRRFGFMRGEVIITEYSHKYTPAGFAALARPAGLVVRRLWTDPAGWFAVALLART